YHWSAIPVRIVHGNYLITLVTSMFMHGGWMHIIGNMIYLWAFGRENEDAMGSDRFLFFYLAGGIVAMMAQILGDPLSRIPAAFVIGLWFLIQLLNIGSVAQVKTGGVAYLAHVGGFLFGVITARVF